MSSEPISPAITGKDGPGIFARIVLFVAAVGIAGSAMVYQRLTGPTHPYRGEFTLGGKKYDYKLIRSHNSDADAPVQIPNPEDATATLHWRQHRTQDEFKTVEFKRPAELTIDSTEKIKDDHLVALLPKQKSAVKLDYYITIKSEERGDARAPGHQDVTIRFKDPVPATILFPHVLCMILTILFGIRAGLGAVFAPSTMRFYAWAALTCMTVGGLVLGPFVQYYAFGEFWTGFPFGSDWTDNKMAVMWLAWLLACAVSGFSKKEREGLPRAAVIVAAIAMTAVYMIPHSMGGSERDPETGEIRTGKPTSLLPASEHLRSPRV